MLKEIQTAIEEDNLILFVGAGMSMSLGLPNWNNLVEQILIRLEEKHGDQSRMNFKYYINSLKNKSETVLEILDEIERKKHRKEAKEILYDIINNISIRDSELINQKKLWEISDKIITTNYDEALDNVKPEHIKSFSNNNAFQQIQSIQGKPFLYKIHGDITNPDTCILFKSDYEDLYKGDKPNSQTLKNFFQNKTLLFLGFSLEDPFITSQIEYLYNLYNGYGNTHFIALTSDKDFSKYNIQTIKVKNWKEGFDTFLDELIEVKESIKHTSQIQIIEEKKEDLDINTIEDISVLESIFLQKSNDLKQQQGEESIKTTKDLFKIKDRFAELHTNKFNFQQIIPNFHQEELEHYFETIFSSQKLTEETIAFINQVKNQNSEKYKWYHRSVIVSSLACSIINHKDLDPAKIDLLIDFANDAEEKVWQKSITYLFLVLNHLGNKWLRYPAIKSKLKRLKDHPEIQEALKSIIQIMQFELQSSSIYSQKVFENEFFSNPFNYFMPFYEGNESINKLYDNDNIDDVEKIIEYIYDLPLPDSLKYLMCNSDDFMKKDSTEEIDRKQRSNFIKALNIHKAFEPYLNDKIGVNEKLNIISVTNIKEHLLNAVEQYRTIGRQFALEKNWGVAITNFNLLLNISPNDIEALMNLVQCFESSGKSIDDKLKIRKQIQNLLPDNSENLFQIGQLYFTKNNNKKSIEYYDRAIDLSPKKAVYYYHRGIVKGQSNFLKEAINDFDSAIGLNPKNSFFHGAKGHVLYHLNEFQLAIEELDYSIKLNNDNHLSYYWRGLTKTYLKNINALEDIDIAIKLNSTNAECYYARGIYNRNHKYNEEAIIDFTKAISINNKKSKFFTKRGDVNLLLKKYPQAISDYDDSLKIDPNESEAYDSKANAYGLISRFKEAHELIDSAINLFSDNGKHIGTKAVIFEYEGNIESFYEYLELSFKKNAKAIWLFDNVKEKYKNEPRFKELLAKYNLTLDDEDDD
jgi:tetratricopeptide (TPR) repeat protein